MKIFWSWQSDTPGKIGRHFIKGALEEAIIKLKTTSDVEEPKNREDVHLDQDRKGVPGSPDLAKTILAKIEASSVFVADVTTVGKVINNDKKLINSNVAIELGYALKTLTDSNVLMIFNQHYGSHEELPFDLRHKGGSIVFKLAPDADNSTIKNEKKELVSTLVEALSYYIEQQEKQPNKLLEKFPETPHTYSRGVYFKPREVLAQVGVRGIDEITSSFDEGSVAYFRFIPRTKLKEPLSISFLKKIISLLPLLDPNRTGFTSTNRYGAIHYSMEGRPSDGPARIQSAIQLFENGEVWGVGKSIVKTEFKEHMPKGTPIPFLPTQFFEQIYYNNIHHIYQCLKDHDFSPNGYTLEMGLIGIQELMLAINGSFLGPIHKPEIIHRSEIISTESIDQALLKFFESVYDATGYSRPANLYNFPPQEASRK